MVKTAASKDVRGKEEIDRAQETRLQNASQGNQKNPKQNATRKRRNEKKGRNGKLSNSDGSNAKPSHRSLHRAKPTDEGYLR